MDLDDFLPEIGEFGRYQKLVLWFLLLPAVVPCGFHAYNQLFMAATPDHWCRVPEVEGLEDYKNISIPLEVRDGELKYSRCRMYDGNYSDLGGVFEEVPCKNGWNFDRSTFGNTVVTQWELVCDKDMLPTVALIVLGIGGLVGDYMFGYVQDGLGRKPAFFIYLFVECLFGLATAFAQSFLTWTIFRIGVGFTVPAILRTPTVLAIELVGPKHRTAVTILINIAYSISLVLLAVVVWAVRDWQTLALVTAAPFLLLFLEWPVLPESPRWLISQGRLEDAEKILRNMARRVGSGPHWVSPRVQPKGFKLAEHFNMFFAEEVNGRKMTSTYLQTIKAKLEEDDLNMHRKYGLLDLFKRPNLRYKTAIITFIWFTNTSVYVGLSYYAPILGGDEYLNFFLAGAVEFPTYLFLWPSLERWGRRWTLCVSMFIGGVACIATFLVQHDSAVTLGLYCVGKMGISSSFVVLPLMASEIYPTVVRGLGMGLSSVVGMLGSVFIPIVNYLGTDMITLPLIIMGTMLVLGGVCSLLLPETLNQHLPESLEDGEKMGLDFFACCTPPQKQSQTVSSDTS